MKKLFFSVLFALIATTATFSQAPQTAIHHLDTTNIIVAKITERVPFENDYDHLGPVCSSNTDCSDSSWEAKPVSPIAKLFDSGTQKYYWLFEFVAPNGATVTAMSYEPAGSVKPSSSKNYKVSYVAMNHGTITRITRVVHTEPTS